MKTSYFALISSEYPGAIAISCWIPQNTNYIRYPKLAPSKELLNNYKTNPNERNYTAEYFDQLFELNPQTVWDELHELAQSNEPILLCYENPKKFCHRRLVAKWFERELGQIVEEYSLGKASDYVQPCLF